MPHVKHRHRVAHWWDQVPGIVRLSMIIGGTLRFAWAIAAWTTPTSHLSDSASYLRMANDFARGHQPRIGGFPSAFYPPGYSLALTPIAWVTQHVGWIPLAFAAAMLNVVAGTVTIWLVYRLSLRYFDQRISKIAACLMALMPEHILFTAAPLSEIVFTALLLASVLMWLNVVERVRSNRPFVLASTAFGALSAYVVLVRGAAVVLGGIVAISLLSSPMRSRRGLAALVLAAVCGTAVLTPWAVRNQREVGILTPLSTNAAAFGCLGNSPGATGGYPDTLDVLRRCFGGSPFSQRSLYGEGDELSARSATEIQRSQIPNSVDESRWFRTTSANTARWIRANPMRFVWLAAVKQTILTTDTSEALDIAEDNGQTRILSRSVGDVVDTVATGYRTALFAAGAVALIAFRSARRAVALWSIAGLMMLSLTFGTVMPRFALPVMPFLAILAAVTFDGLLRARNADTHDGALVKRPGPRVSLRVDLDGALDQQ